MQQEEISGDPRLSPLSVDVLISSGVMKPTRKGRRVFVLRAELERVAALNPAAIWPSKVNGKTTRHFAPPAKVKRDPGGIK
jgi:hypothetical protein